MWYNPQTSRRPDEADDDQPPEQEQRKGFLAEGALLYRTFSWYSRHDFVLWRACSARKDEKPLPYLRIYVSDADYLRLTDASAALGLSVNEYSHLYLTATNLDAEYIRAADLRKRVEKARARQRKVQDKLHNGVKPLFSDNNY